jgi:hypothetical protein
MTAVDNSAAGAIIQPSCSDIATYLPDAQAR